MTAPPLQCKLRLRQDLPESLRRGTRYSGSWQSGLPDYETLAAEAQRRLAVYGADDALRGLSSLVEDRPGDAALARDRPSRPSIGSGPARPITCCGGPAGRTFEPITFHAMAHCLEQMGRADLAIVYYELACGGQWDGRFGDIHNIAQLDYLRFLRRWPTAAQVFIGRLCQGPPGHAWAMQLRDTADVAALSSGTPTARTSICT